MTRPTTPAASPAGAKFVELIRVSTEGQSERDTPQDQIAALERLRLSRPGVFVDRIIETVSGACDVADRPDIRRLRELARSVSGVAKALNAEGYRSRSGRPWTDGNVARLLRQPSAAGHYRSHGFSIELTPIVDEEIWRAAQAKLAASKGYVGRKPKVAGVALLRHPIGVCGDCGATLWARRGGGDGKHYLLYVCSKRCTRTSNHVHAEDCCTTSNHVRVEDVDRRFTAILHEWLTDPARLRSIIEDVTGGREDSRRDVEKEMASAQKVLSNIQRERLNVARMVAREQIDERNGDTLLAEAKAREAEAEKRVAQAREALDAVEHQAEAADSIEAMVEAVRRCPPGSGQDTPEFWREVVQFFFPPGSVRLGIGEGKSRLTLTEWHRAPPCKPGQDAKASWRDLAEIGRRMASPDS